MQSQLPNISLTLSRINSSFSCVIQAPLTNVKDAYPQQGSFPGCELQTCT